MASDSPGEHVKLCIERSLYPKKHHTTQDTGENTLLQLEIRPEPICVNLYCFTKFRAY